MRGAGITLLTLAAAPMLVAGCAGDGTATGAAPASSPPAKSSSGPRPPEIPTLVYSVVNTNQRAADDSADLKENVAVEVEVTIHGNGRWRRSGDLTGSGRLTAAQIRRLATLVRSDAFLAQMAHPKRRENMNCPAVVPEYNWSLRARGHTASPGCAMIRPKVSRALELIKRYTDVCRATTNPAAVRNGTAKRRECTG